jgi:alkanesulfonate monooxygenase SsuD/methylene tetrahydromethanopterin reductase-like flavin-dependent oxidoreductase (luciferase family)
VQKPHPPIRIAANSAETATFAGRHGYPIFVATPVNPVPQFFEQARTYQQAWRAAGHPAEADDIAAAFLVYTADTLGQARRETEASLSYYFHTVGELIHLGERGLGQQSYEYLRGVQERASIAYEQVHDTMAVFGNPDECIARITDIHQRAAIRQLICWFNPGGLVPHRQVMRAMQRFATDVIPATKNL